MRTLAATGLATASTVNFVSVMTGGPVERPPARLPVRFCDAEIFELFNIDFRYGGAFTGVPGTGVAGASVRALAGGRGGRALRHAEPAALRRRRQRRAA